MSENWMPGMMATGNKPAAAPKPAAPTPPEPEPTPAPEPTPEPAPEPAPVEETPETSSDDDGYPADGNVGEVLEWAGDNADRRVFALAAELEREHPRKGVTGELRGD